MKGEEVLHGRGIVLVHDGLTPPHRLA
jgi:hypothetical protein